MTTWPAHYPDECPPDYAVNPSGNIYRFTNRTNPKQKDFFSYYEHKPDYDWGSKACVARGLTVFTTEEDCIAAAAAIPALKKKHLAKAELPPNTGAIAATPSKSTKNHKTLWPLISAENLAKIFTPAYETGVSSV